MSTPSSIPALTASENAGSSAVSTQADDKSVFDDGDWFSNAAKQLFPTKAGTSLHYTTGVDERTCQRYAAGHVRPPAYFLRALLRSKQGWTWLCVVMADADADWWRDVQLAVECANAFEARKRELNETSPANNHR